MIQRTRILETDTLEFSFKFHNMNLLPTDLNFEYNINICYASNIYQMH